MTEKYVVPEGVPVFTSKRWILAYTAIFGFFFLYCVRTNISVAIVCMVKSQQMNITAGGNLTQENLSDMTKSCANEASKTFDTTEFEWDKSTQSAILSSFFYGYFILQIPGGWLAGRFGGKKVIGSMFVVNALTTLLVPVCARLDYRLVMALRILLGISSSVTYPAMQTMWGVWAPPLERSRLASFTYSGSLIGNIFTFSASGLLCEYGFDNGWGSIFYIIGTGTLLWAGLWMFVVADTPSEHPTITKLEQRYIIDSIGDKDGKVLSTPWKKLFLCRANWSCLAAHFCNNWMHYTLMTSLPTFMKAVLKFDIKTNGLLSAVPYIAMVVVSIAGGHVADWLRKNYLSTRFVRRSFQSISFLGSAACLVGVGFVTCENRYVAVALLTTAVGLEGLVNSGFMVNTIDFAPRYAGLLFGINNTISTIPGMLAPLVAGALTPNDTPEEWRNVFYVCAGLIFLAALVFGFTAQTDLEPWARAADSESTVAHPTPIKKLPEENGVEPKLNKLSIICSERL
ncbi:uncharacterized transporter slc-17.2-like [Haliotis rufescens]|uniref:uncharacterized transporter slc-17.2-like n=1 Tax=Haliotis rufescens TaxID=6454 RepID=UPI001EAFAF63|nr:uncharacterized transporter slc-17.2-like [Haliotis rufescens]